MGDIEREAEFTAYVLAHQDRFIRFAYLLTGDPHSAEDLVQSALANVYRRWHTIHGSRCLRPTGHHQRTAQLVAALLAAP